MNRIKELRQSKGLTQAELAQKVGISEQSVSFYENDRRKPKIETWNRLADFFNVSIPYLKGLPEPARKNRLKELRNQRKLTLDDIEEKTGIKRGTYSNYENRKTEPKLEVWQKLADFFNVSVTYLQGFETQVPNRLRELRRSHGLTLKDTVEKVKEKEALIITADALAKYERGDREPKIETWQKLADYFGVSVTYIQGGLDTEYLEKIVETLMLINLPGLVLKYRNNELDNLYKPFITIAFTSRIINLLGYDSREKFEEIYTKAIKLGDSHLNSNELKEYKRYLIKILTTSKEIANNLLKEYEKLEEKQK